MQCLVCSHTAKEIELAGLIDVVHRRRFKLGNRPGMTCNAITGGEKVRSEDQSWIPPSEQPSTRQIMKMLGMMISFCIKMAMRNHYYIFNNEIRRQGRGGATGNSLTMELSRMFGLWWDKQFLQMLESLQVKMMGYWRYVDDNGNALRSIDPGVRMVIGEEVNDSPRMEVKAELVEQDNLKSEDERTAALLTEVANCIHQ